MKVCSNCKQINSDEAQYCIYCGARIEDQEKEVIERENETRTINKLVMIIFIGSFVLSVCIGLFLTFQVYNGLSNMFQNNLNAVNSSSIGETQSKEVTEPDSETSEPEQDSQAQEQAPAVTPPAENTYVGDLTTHEIPSLDLATDPAVFSVSASSTYPDYEGFSYGASNLTDGDLSTAWVEGVAGDGIGEKVSFTYKGLSPCYLEWIDIVTGYTKTETTFNRNGAPLILSMYLNDTKIGTITLMETMSAQEVNFPTPIKLSPNSVLSFVLESVRQAPDSLDHDSAITEIVLAGNSYY